VKQVNWAIVGMGDIVQKRVGPAIVSHPDCVLHACVTRDPAKSRAILDQLKPKQVCTDFDQMLRDPTIDAVYLANPTFLHAPHTIAALRAGKHVLVEKPMAMNAAEAQTMIDTANQSGRKLAVAYYRRFWDRFSAVHELLKANRLGKIVSVRVTMQSWYAPPAESSGAWRVSRNLSGGGVLADVGSHKLDLLDWWLGIDKVICSRVATLTHSYDAEDSASFVLQSAVGALINGSFHWNTRGWTDEIQIVGTDAMMSLAPCDGDEILISSGRDQDRIPTSKPTNAHYPLIDDFARSIIDGRAPRFTAADSIAATKALDAIYSSGGISC
jgi:predicted dehydrogenase